MAQLPNAIREILLQSHPHAALVFDSLLHIGYTSDAQFTVGGALVSLWDAGIYMTDSTIRKGLKQAQAAGLVAWRTRHHRTRGAPPTIYRLSPVQLMAQKLNVKLGVTDELPIEAFANLSVYRAHLHRAFLLRCPGDYPRKWLGERIGTSPRSTYNYEQYFDDVVVKPNFIETEITWDNIDTLPERNPETGPVFLRVYEEIALTPEEIEAENADIGELWRCAFPRRRYRWEEKRYPALRCIAIHLLLEKHYVERVQQVANSYKVGVDYSRWFDSG